MEDIDHPDTLGVEESSSPKTIPTRTSNGPRVFGGPSGEDTRESGGICYHTPQQQPLESVFPPYSLGRSSQMAPQMLGDR